MQLRKEHRGKGLDVLMAGEMENSAPSVRRSHSLSGHPERVSSTAHKRRIDYTDSEIDKLVYKLYGLTEEEIRIVEGEG